MGFTLSLEGAEAEDIGTGRNSEDQDVMFPHENDPSVFGVGGWAGLAGEDDRPTRDRATCIMDFRSAE